jgi:hypothetical protein
MSIRGSKLCLTIVGALEWAPLHEGVRFAVTCHIEMGVFDCLVRAWALAHYGLPGRCCGGDACHVSGADGMVLAPRDVTSRLKALIGLRKILIPSSYTFFSGSPL